MIYVPLSQLKTNPYNDPNATRDELVFFIKPNSYVLPVLYHTDQEVVVGDWAWKKVTKLWKTTGEHVYLLNMAYSIVLAREIRNNLGKDHPLVDFFLENRYVTKRIHFMEFPQPIVESEKKISGFFVISKYVEVTTVMDQWNVASNLQPESAREPNPNLTNNLFI